MTGLRFHQLVKYEAALEGYGFAGRPRKRFLLIPRARIFDSSVERAMPSRAAAPVGPNTRPPLARRASSMIVFSWPASALDNASRLSTAGPVDSQLSSTMNSSVSHTITDRSITFCSSRTFPGQGYDLQAIERLFLDAPNRLARFPGVAIDEVLGEQRNVFSSFAQRRHPRGNTFSR